MKVGVVIIFIVIQVITCEKAASKLRRKLIVPKMNEECKKIKCPSVEEPVCVKMTRHDLGRSMHIVAANRCELDYIKCHDGVEAKMVPMKYCGHHAAPSVGDKKNKMGKHIRVKRGVPSIKSTDDPFEMLKQIKREEENEFKGDNQTQLELHKAKLNRLKLARMHRNNVISKGINKYSVLNDVNRLKKKHGRQNPLNFMSSDIDSDLDKNEGVKLEQEELKLSPVPQYLVIDEKYKKRPNVLGLNDVEEIQPKLSLHLDDFNMFSEESTNISKELMDAADRKEYESSCPTVCPSRDVMVCGRCQHGVYKTFISVCHMKMFSCNHDDEVMELISRYPCVLSAPYLSEDVMQPKGRIREAGDDDKVLRFLICQERGGSALGPNGKPISLLLLIQLGYIIAKAVETPNSCNDSHENDPRIKRSDETDIDSEITENTTKGPEDLATGEKFPEQNNENDDGLDKSDNGNEKTNEFASNLTILPQNLPLVSHTTEFPANIEKEGNVTNKLTTKAIPLEQPVYYKAIDPKYLIISGLKPIPNKNVTNISKPAEPVSSLEESKTALLDDVNTTKLMYVSNKSEPNDTVGKEKEIANDNRYTDITNIREIREHLLDHLLDYFINIIKEEKFNRNNTRKNNGKDRMKVEDKLRNYYGPHHLDMLIVDDDDDYDDNNPDYHGNDSEEDLLDNDEEPNRGNVTNIMLNNTLADKIEINASETHKPSKDLQELPLQLEEHLNSSSSDGEPFNVTLPEPVTPEDINLNEEENDLGITLLKTTEKSEAVYESNINVKTTERSFLNEALNDGTAESDTEPSNYSGEIVTDKIGHVYDNGALIIDDYTSYEDYIDSDEFQVVKHVSVHENEKNPIIDTKENGRRNNVEVSVEYATLGGIKNESSAQILTKSSTNTSSSKHDTDVRITLANGEQPNTNIDDDAPCNEDNLSENKNKNSSKKSKHGGIKGKRTRNKNCGRLVYKNKKSKRHNCRQSIVLNLKINII